VNLFVSICRIIASGYNIAACFERSALILSDIIYFVKRDRERERERSIAAADNTGKKGKERGYNHPWAFHISYASLTVLVMHAALYLMVVRLVTGLFGHVHEPQQLYLTLQFIYVPLLQNTSWFMLQLIYNLLVRLNVTSITH
jgi:hypothetical protein